MPIMAIAVYVPKEESRLSLSVPRKKIDTRKPIASGHYTGTYAYTYTYTVPDSFLNTHCKTVKD